jgi:hypothetical protein
MVGLLDQVLPSRAFCSLENNIPAVLLKSKFKYPLPENYSLTSDVKPDSILLCRIEKINFDQNEVLLTAEKNKLEERKYREGVAKDPYFQDDFADEQILKDILRKQGGSGGMGGGAAATGAGAIRPTAVQQKQYIR